MKRKIITAVCAAALVMSLTACGNNNPAQTTAAPVQTSEAPAQTSEAPAQTAEAAASFTAADVTKAVLDEVPINSAFEKKKESLEDYFYKLDVSTLKDQSFWMCASGAYPDEIAVFEFDSAESAAAGKEAAEARLKEQKDVYETYTPEEFYKLEGAVVEKSGNYVYYLVTSDNAKAKSIVKGFIK